MVNSLFAQTPQRIVSLAPNITETLYTLGLGKKIVAVTNHCDFPDDAKTKHKVGGFTNPSIEEIINSKPDIVVMTSDGNPWTVYKKLLSMGTNIHLFNATKISDLPNAIRKMGYSLGAEKQAEIEAQKIEKWLGVVAKKTKERKKLSAVFIIQTEPLIVAGKETHIDEIMQFLSLTNIADKATGKYPRFSFEEFLIKNPDIIIIGNHKDRIIGSHFLSKISSTNAYKNNQIIYANDAIMRLSPQIIDATNEIDVAIKKYRLNIEGK